MLCFKKLYFFNVVFLMLVFSLVSFNCSAEVINEKILSSLLYQAPEGSYDLCNGKEPCFINVKKDYPCGTTGGVGIGIEKILIYDFDKDGLKDAVVDIYYSRRQMLENAVYYVAGNNIKKTQLLRSVLMGKINMSVKNNKLILKLIEFQWDIEKNDSYETEKIFTYFVHDGNMVAD